MGLSLRKRQMIGCLIAMTGLGLGSGATSAEEFYWCADGHMVVLSDKTRMSAIQSDPCVIAWATSPRSQSQAQSQKASPVNWQPNPSAKPSEGAQMLAAAQETLEQKAEDRAGAEGASPATLVNAEEVPATKASGARQAPVIAKPTAGKKRSKRQQAVQDRHVRSSTAERKPRDRAQTAAYDPNRGLTYMGDGLYAR